MREVGAALSINEEQEEEEEEEEEEEKEEMEQRETYFVLSLVSEVKTSKPCGYRTMSWLSIQKSYLLPS